MSYDNRLTAGKLRRWEKFLQDYRLPKWEDIPDFGLYMEQVLALLRQYGLPVDCAYPVEQMLGTILHDKKASGGSINLIVPTAVGSCEIRKTPASEISGWLRAGGAK